MQQILSFYGRITRALSGPIAEGVALLAARIALAGVFWRSGRSKVTEGTWLEISDATFYLFEYEYDGVPLPVDVAATLATYAEHLLPILLVIGLMTRFAALGLLAMTAVIQIFVYPEAWWTVHVIWAALAAVIISRGAGLFALDAAIVKAGDRT